MPRILLPLLLVVAACSPLRTFDALVPKDQGAQLVAKDQPFMAGRRGTLDIYAPKGAGANLPMIVFFYGGSWNSGSKETYGFVGRALATQGFVVAIPDYRLVPDVRFPAFLEDGTAAVRWLRANARRFGADPDRIVLSGHSAGGYNATMLSVDPRWLGSDRTAIKGFIALAAPHEFLPLDTEVTQTTFSQAPDLDATQPINLASADDPPGLLLAGGRDKLVFPSQSTGMAIAMVDSGAKAEAIIYKKVGHVGILTALALPLRRKAPVMRDLIDFAKAVTASQP